MKERVKGRKEGGGGGKKRNERVKREREKRKKRKKKEKKQSESQNSVRKKIKSPVCSKNSMSQKELAKNKYIYVCIYTQVEACLVSLCDSTRALSLLYCQR